jgi:hypothetical protein
MNFSLDQLRDAQRCDRRPVSLLHKENRAGGHRHRIGKTGKPGLKRAYFDSKPGSKPGMAKRAKRWKKGD